MSESVYLTRAREWLDRRFGTKPILVMPADEQDLASLLTQVRNETLEEAAKVADGVCANYGASYAGRIRSLKSPG